MKIKPRILCPITNWKERKVTRGKTVGNTITERLVIGADKFNWIIGTQKLTEQADDMVADSYYGSMKHLLPTLEILTENPKESANLIIGSLVKLTGKRPEIKTKDPFENMGELGEWIDKSFGTNFLEEYPPRVKQTLFNEQETEDED